MAVQRLIHELKKHPTWDVRHAIEYWNGNLVHILNSLEQCPRVLTVDDFIDGGRAAYSSGATPTAPYRWARRLQHAHYSGSCRNCLPDDFAPLGALERNRLTCVLSVSAGSNLTPGVQLLLSGGLALVGIAALLLIGKYILPRILLEAARQRSGEAMIVVSTAAALGAASATRSG